MYKSGHSSILLCCSSSYSVLGQTSGVLLPQLQNFNFLCTRENLCPSATTTPEFFSPDRSSAVPLPQLQNVSHQRNILLFCYHNCRIFLTRKYSAAIIAECFSPEKNSVVLLPQLPNASATTYSCRIFFLWLQKSRTCVW